MTATEHREIPNEDVYIPPRGEPRHNGHNGNGRLADTRVPPHDLDAEASLLGACLIPFNRGGHACTSPAVAAAQHAGITAQAFYRPAHGHVWDAIAGLDATGVVPDPVTVADALHRDGLLDAAGGHTTLADLMNTTPAISNAGNYARIVAELARMRGWISVAADIADLGYSMPGDVDTIDDLVDAHIARIRDQYPTRSTSAWAPIDLAARTGAVESPYLLTRSDGRALFYIGKVNSLAGPPESAKSWTALTAHAELARSGHHSAYIDYEDNPDSISFRLRLLGLDDDELARVHYFWPDTGIEGALAALNAIGEPLDLVTVDSNTRATLASGGKTNSTDDAATIGRALAHIARTTGAGVVLLDHVTKDDDPDSPYSRGAGDKLAYIDGAAYKVKVLAIFAPGRTGKTELTCVKDRPGGARGHFKNGRGAAHYTLTSAGEGEAVVVDLHAIEDRPGETTEAGDFRPTVYMERLSRALELRPEGVGVKELRTLIDGKRHDIKDRAARILVEEGFVEIVPGPHGARLHKSTNPFREAGQ